MGRSRGMFDWHQRATRFNRKVLDCAEVTLINALLRFLFLLCQRGQRLIPLLLCFLFLSGWQNMCDVSQRTIPVPL